MHELLDGVLNRRQLLRHGLLAHNIPAQALIVGPAKDRLNFLLDFCPVHQVLPAALLDRLLHGHDEELLGKTTFAR